MAGLLGDAFAFASLAHREINHQRQVAQMVAECGADVDVVAATLLQDVVAATSWVTMETLHRYGFPARVLRAVDGVTCRPDEQWAAYIVRAAVDQDSRLIKLADLALDLSVMDRDLVVRPRVILARRVLVEANAGIDPWGGLAER